MMEQHRGLVLPSPTVFLDDGRVDEKLMGELPDWYLACGVQAAQPRSLRRVARSVRRAPWPGAPIKAKSA
jgi:hypothetical protein